MAISQIVQNSLANTITLGVKVATINIANSGYSILDDTAINIGGGYIVITGEGFKSGATVYVDNVAACSTTFVSSTQLRAQLPAAAAGSYVLYVYNTDGTIGAKPNGITYSGIPTWVTGSSLTQSSNTPFANNFNATGAVLYQLQSGSSFPTGLSFANTANGYYTGNVSVGSDTTFNFTVEAIDAENQETPRTFSLLVTVGPNGLTEARAWEYVSQADGVAAGTYWIKTSSGAAEQLYIYKFNGYAYALVGCRYQSSSTQTSVNTDSGTGTPNSGTSTFLLSTTKIRYMIGAAVTPLGMLMVPQQASGALAGTSTMANLFRSSNTERRIQTDMFTNSHAGEGENGTSVRSLNLSSFNPTSYPTNNWWDLDSNAHEGGNQILSFFGEPTGSFGSLANGGTGPLGIRWSNANGHGYHDGLNVAGNDVTGGARNLTVSPIVSLFLLAR